MITLIAIQQERLWKQTVRQALNYDFYHTWDYHKMSEDGFPFLLKYCEGNDFIALPLVKRSIPNSKFFDLTSVYGYSGPISNKDFNNISDQMKDNFKKEFSEFLKDNDIVSVFSRLNPFLNQLLLMNGLKGVYANGKVVVIDLRESFEKQLSRYQSHHLKKILKLKQQGFYVKESKNRTAIKEFAAMYSENMKQVRASAYYMFKEDYFEKLLRSKDFHSKLFLVYYNDEPVCGEIVTFTNRVIHSHLLATRTAYRKFAPAKLLTHELSVIGRRLGMHYFNLGGGFGFKEDSLFEWKAAFSDLFFEYNTWRHIADKETYRNLTLQANINPENDVDFFPLYRYKASHSLSVSALADEPALADNQIIQKISERSPPV